MERHDSPSVYNMITLNVTFAAFIACGTRSDTPELRDSIVAAEITTRMTSF